MKKIIIGIVLVTTLTNCKGQENKITNKKEDTMKTFDINKFEENNKNRNVKEFTLENGDEVQQFTGSNNNGFIERIKKKNTPYIFANSYYSNGNIEGESKTFYGFPIGITKEYDEKGKLVKETNHDEKYPFSVDELCKLIQTEYGVNLMIKSDPNKNELQYRVNRQYEPLSKQYLYLVVFSFGYSDEGEPGFPVKEVYIDGITGNVLYEKSTFLNRNGGDKIPKSKTQFPQKPAES